MNKKQKILLVAFGTTDLKKSIKRLQLQAQNSKFYDGIFYTLNFRNSDVSSNIANHDVERKFFTIGLTKRFNLNELFK